MTYEQNQPVMIERETVSKIMTKNVVTVDADDSLIYAERLMRSHHIRHVPVLAGEKLVGMLSLTDLLRISFVDKFGEREAEVDAAIYNMLTVPQVMVGNPVTVNATSSVKDVAQILSHREFHALPVVHDEVLVGIVTTTDLIKFLLEKL